jgi:hypothetical protein
MEIASEIMPEFTGIEVVVFFLLGCVLGVTILYLVIKYAVKAGTKEALRELQQPRQ